MFIWIIFVESKNITTVIDETIAIITGQSNIRNHAINFHITDIGTISQYHVVVIVTTAHHKVWGIEINDSLFQYSFSTKKTSVELIIKIINIVTIADKYSTLCLLIQLIIFEIIGILSINSKILKILKILNITKIE